MTASIGMLALPQLTGCALVPATASRPRVRSHTQMVDSLPLLLSRRSAVTLLAAVLPICGPSCPVASAMESGIYGRNERVVIPILGDQDVSGCDEGGRRRRSIEGVGAHVQ